MPRPENAGIWERSAVDMQHRLTRRLCSISSITEDLTRRTRFGPWVTIFTGYSACRLEKRNDGYQKSRRTRRILRLTFYEKGDYQSSNARVEESAFKRHRIGDAVCWPTS